MPEQATKPGPKPGTPAGRPKSPARKLQEEVIQHDPKKQPTFNVVFRFDNPDQADMNIQLPAEAIRAILDPDVPDTFIPVESDMPNAMKHRYIHTKSVREVLFREDILEGGA